MTGKFVKDFVNLLIYGGAFIGLCAACITALTFELTGQADNNLTYIFLVGAATASLYALHRVIGLNRTMYHTTLGRFGIIRKYQFHIRVYTVFWVMLTLGFLMPILSLRFLLILTPGALIGFAYVIPFLPDGRRLRDLGWGKILMISWSWAWLTAVVPLWYFTEASGQLIVIHGLERMLFIMVIAIPFEIRDLNVDRSVGLITMPDKLGKKKTIRIVYILTGLILFLAFIASFHYFNPAYGIAIGITSVLLIPLISHSYSIDDDYYFGGLTDGMMIVALWLFIGANQFV